MYTHVAIFKWKSGTNQEDIDAALKEVEALQDKVSGVVEIRTGKNESKYSEGYTHVVLVRGESREAVEDYRNHPDHKKVASSIEAMEEKGIGIDVETVA